MSSIWVRFLKFRLHKALNHKELLWDCRTTGSLDKLQISSAAYELLIDFAAFASRVAVATFMAFYGHPVCVGNCLQQRWKVNRGRHKRTHDMHATCTSSSLQKSRHRHRIDTGRKACNEAQIYIYIDWMISGSSTGVVDSDADWFRVHLCELCVCVCVSECVWSLSMRELLETSLA